MYIILVGLVVYGLFLCVKLGSLSRTSRKLADMYNEASEESESPSLKIFYKGMANSYKTGNPGYATDAYWTSRMLENIENSKLYFKPKLDNKKGRMK